ncbi:hypothetical protein SprV_0702358700 [Sparganum proliferum]
MAGVDGPGLRSVEKCRQDDDLGHLQFGIQLVVVAILHGVLQSTEGLTGFGEPVGHFVADSDAVRHWAARVAEVIRDLQFGAIDANAEGTVFSGQWLLMHDHLQSEMGTNGGEEIHAPLNVFFGRAVECAVAREEQIVDSNCGETRQWLHLPALENVPVGPVIAADPGVMITVGINQHGRGNEPEAGLRPRTYPLHAISHNKRRCP